MSQPKKPKSWCKMVEIFPDYRCYLSFLVFFPLNHASQNNLFPAFSSSFLGGVLMWNVIARYPCALCSTVESESGEKRKVATGQWTRWEGGNFGNEMHCKSFENMIVIFKKKILSKQLYAIAGNIWFNEIHVVTLMYVSCFIGGNFACTRM